MTDRPEIPISLNISPTVPKPIRSATVLNEKQIAYIQSLKASELAPTFLKLYKAEKVEKAQWIQWNQVWGQAHSPRNRTNTRSLNDEAAQVFKDSIDKGPVEDAQ